MPYWNSSPQSPNLPCSRLPCPGRLGWRYAPYVQACGVFRHGFIKSSRGHLNPAIVVVFLLLGIEAYLVSDSPTITSQVKTLRRGHLLSGCTEIRCDFFIGPRIECTYEMGFKEENHPPPRPHFKTGDKIAPFATNMYNGIFTKPEHELSLAVAVFRR